MANSIYSITDKGLYRKQRIRRENHLIYITSIFKIKESKSISEGYL